MGLISEGWYAPHRARIGGRTSLFNAHQCSLLVSPRFAHTKKIYSLHCTLFMTCKYFPIGWQLLLIHSTRTQSGYALLKGVTPYEKGTTRPQLATFLHISVLFATQRQGFSFHSKNFLVYL